MSASTAARDLIASFPAAGSGGTTLEQLKSLAARRGVAYVALSNPASVDALTSGRWQAESTKELRRAVDEASAYRVILVGHCMGGLSAVRLSDGLGATLGLAVRVLLMNTPCPDASGRIPTMSRLSDAEIADILRRDGFPEEVLEDEDMLVEVAESLRQDATVADRLAEWVASTGQLESLYVLSTRGDTFIPPHHCATWWHRVSGEFQLMITAGGHAIDEASVGILDRAIESVLSHARADPA